MSWWVWCLVAGAVALSAVAFVVFLAALFAKGDNPEGKWWL